MTGPEPSPLAPIEVPMPEQPQFELLAHEHAVERREREAAVLLGHVEVHQADRVRLGDQVVGMVRAFVVVGRLRPDLLRGELTRQRTQLLLLVRQGERDTAHGLLDGRHRSLLALIDSSVNGTGAPDRISPAWRRPRSPPPSTTQLLAIDALFDDEERADPGHRAQVRPRPHAPGGRNWFERGGAPSGAREGARPARPLGMHLEGIGLPGASSVAYGLTCMELEAGTPASAASSRSRARSRCSQSGAGGLPRSQEAALAAGDARRGRDRVLRADRARRRLRPGSMPTPQTRRSRLGPERIEKMWITNGRCRRRRRVGAHRGGAINGFLVERGMPGFEAPEMHPRCRSAHPSPPSSCSTTCASLRRTVSPRSRRCVARSHA